MQHTLLLVLTLAVVCVSCTSSNADTGLVGKSQNDTNRAAVNKSGSLRRLEVWVTTETENNTNNAKIEERLGLSFLKISGAAKSLPKSPKVAKVVQQRTDITKIVETSPNIRQTIGKMQNDKFLMGEVRSSPVLGKLRSSLHKSPSKKLSVADVQNIGVATMKSMKSTKKWYHSPGYAVPVGVIVVLMAVVGPVLLVGGIAN